MHILFNIFQIASVIALPIIFLFIYFRTLNEKVSTILKSLPENSKAVFKDARVWFKGFDMYKKKDMFHFNPLKALYAFNIADLYVQNDKLIVVGKTRILGRKQLLQPFAICWIGKEYQIANITLLTRQISTILIGNDVEIEFEDYEYKNPIKLVVKKIGKELYQQIEATANK